MELVDPNSIEAPLNHITPIKTIQMDISSRISLRANEIDAILAFQPNSSVPTC